MELKQNWKVEKCKNTETERFKNQEQMNPKNGKIYN